METSNEARREAARRLRHFANSEMVGDSLLRTLKDVTGATSWRGCLDELADLVECPTCTMERDEMSYYPNVTFQCSACGGVIYYDCRPSFCPECGAEVIWDD